MKVNAYKCPECNQVIYSRTRHDFRTCDCGTISADGGFDYSRILFKTKPPNPVSLDVEVTKTDLYYDWNKGEDKYGKVS